MRIKLDYGRTGLDVSVASLGCGGYSRLGRDQGATAAESVALVRAVLSSCRSGVPGRPSQFCVFGSPEPSPSPVTLSHLPATCIELQFIL